LQTYMTLRQMKILGIEYGDLGKPNFKTVKMSTIVNQRTIWDLAEQTKKNPAMSDADRLRQTHSVLYAETAITQAGAKIVDARVENATSTRGGEYAAEKGSTDELAKRGLSPGDPVRKYFDIILTVAPFEPKPNVPSEIGDK